jgi:hypothetical protein
MSDLDVLELLFCGTGMRPLWGSDLDVWEVLDGLEEFELGLS